jgi:hypothetical protein
MDRIRIHSILSIISITLLSLAFLGCPPITPPVINPPTPPDPGSGIIAAPVFNPPEGTYTSARSVTISCSTPGTTLRYTTDGTQPSATSVQYSGAINVSATTTLRAIAIKSGLMSSFGRADFVITGKVAAPVVSPPSNSFTAPVEISITCATSNAVIRYTLDGSYPQPTSPVYGGPFTISSTSGVCAVARLGGWDDSDMSFSTIVINIPPTTAAPPAISPAGGLYYTDQTISITQPDAEFIYYTTDGSDPTVSGTRVQYAGTFTVTTTNTLVRAYAIDTDKTNQDSAIVSATYRLKAAMPVASPDPAAGPIGMSTIITLSSTTPGAAIYYNLSDLNPTTLYDGTGITRSKPSLRAIAMKTGYEDSDTLAAEYSLKSQFGYTDGNGKIYRLIYHGADLDITNLFDHASISMSFCYMNSATPSPTLYSSGGHVYQLVQSGPDIEITSGFDNFGPGSVLFDFVGALVNVVYRTGDRLYMYDPNGIDADITPPYFTSTSEILYAVFTNGAGQVYMYSQTSPTDMTSIFEHFTSSSRLTWIDLGQTIAPPLGYVTGVDRWIISNSADIAFDPSEYEHFDTQSVIAIMWDLN